jgi:hypothetical protein
MGFVLCKFVLCVRWENLRGDKAFLGGKGMAAAMESPILLVSQVFLQSLWPFPENMIWYTLRLHRCCTWWWKFDSSFQNSRLGLRCSKFPHYTAVIPLCSSHRSCTDWIMDIEATNVLELGAGTGWPGAKLNPQISTVRSRAGRPGSENWHSVADVGLSRKNWVGLFYKA